jgi:DNA replication protein DnaC
MLSEAKAIFGSDPEVQDASERAIKARYSHYQFLAVDEVERISGTSWAMAFIFSVLDDRYNSRGFRATMIATNSMPGTLGEDFGYLEDRMKDGQRVVVAGRSLRGINGR